MNTTEIQTDQAGDEFPWPRSEGYWMGFLNGDWFPMKTMFLVDDCPRPDGNPPPPQIVLPIVVQYPKSEESWPFLFAGNHPVNRWRLPTAEEAIRIRTFYSLPPIS